MSDPVQPPEEPALVDRPWNRRTAFLIQDFLRRIRQLSTQPPGRHAKTHMRGGGDTLPLDKLTSKGDLLTRSSLEYARLPVGTNGQVLTADSSAANGIKWAAGSGNSDDAMLYAFYMGN